MGDLYRIHFGFSKSKRYNQAVEIAKLAFDYKTTGYGEDIEHIVCFTREQVDLMALLYKITRGFRRFISRKINGVNISSIILYCRNGQYNNFYVRLGYKDRIREAAEKLREETGKSFSELADYLKSESNEEDNKKVLLILKQEGYLDYIDENGKFKNAVNKPKEYISKYKTIKSLIAERNYKEAIKVYYDTLGDKFHDELHSELIYLKRLAKMPLIGRDLLYFRTESTRNDLIKSNIKEYCSCIDETLKQYKKNGFKSPTDIIIENAPTMEDLVEKRKHDWHRGVFLWNGEFKIDNTPVNVDYFSNQYDKCLTGRLFEKYPNQIQHCNITETPLGGKYNGLWTTYSEEYYQKQIIDKGLWLYGIEAYRHKAWHETKRVPDFTTVTSLHDIEKRNYGTNGIRYTGRSHKINDAIFYEIDLIRKDHDLTNSSEILLLNLSMKF